MSKNHGFTLELIHPNSPKSPFYNTAETQLQRISNFMYHSINRVNYLNHMLFVSKNNLPESTITPVVGQGYVIDYSIGTPPFKLYGVLDTGSDYIWFQCKPCKSCYNQTSPMFDPSKSSTYKTLPCTSPACKYLHKGICSSKNKDKCEYDYRYADNSRSQGYLSVDTLTLNSNDRSPISFPRIVIGCGHKNSFSVDGNFSGIIGIGRGPLSFLSQLESSIEGKFSYCLVPFSSNANTTSKLNFGDNAIVSGPGTTSTPLVVGMSNSSYVTILEAFSVGDIVIKLDPFAIQSDIKGNTIIDSGSTFTHLPHQVYYELEDAVAAMVNLKRVKDPTKQLSLCYKSTLDILEAPVITAHFSGADIDLNADNTFIQIDHEVVCFAFVPNENFLPIAIFGNIAQQNFLVGFDILKNVVSFKPSDCTKQ